jgi:two-component system capsular synthesis sensor histidine kinase RcsC
LHHACFENDRTRFLGLLHRLKGALLALNERAMVEASDRLRASIESHGLLLVRPEIDVFIEQMREIADAYRAG